jgi:hypothetical protein
MTTVIEERRVKAARSEYHCGACEWIDFHSLRDYTFTFPEWRALLKARNNNQMICKGDSYIRQRNKSGSDIWTFKAIPEIHAICLKYGYYEY